MREEISDMLRREVNDPRLERFISVTRVEILPDLSEARAYVSVVGSPEEKKDTLRAFESAAGFFRRELSHRIKIKQMPQLSFVVDESIEKGERILDLIDRVHTDTGKGA